jgi:hypothetical protein
MNLPNTRLSPPPAGHFAIVQVNGELKAMDSNGVLRRVRTERGTPVHYTAGTKQSVTRAVTAASGCTSNGNLSVTVTSARFPGALPAVLVALTTAVHTTATLIATAIKNALLLVPAITKKFAVTSTSATVILTALDPHAPDATLDIAIATGLGASAGSQTGINGVARVSATTGEIGDELLDDTNRYICLARVTLTSTSGWLTTPHSVV